MAVSNKPRGRFWSHLHFWLRFLGLTGLLAAGVGAVLAGVRGLLPDWDAGRPAADNIRTLWDFARATAEENVRGVIERQPGDLFVRVVVGLVLVGGALALLALLVEILGAL